MLKHLFVAAAVLGATPLTAQTRTPPPTASTDTAPAPSPPLSLLDVRLACINPDSTTAPDASREMRKLCRLPISRSVRDAATWSRWAEAANRQGLRELIRERSNYDPGQLKLADVIGNLEDAERTRVIRRLFADQARFQRAARGLTSTQLAELYHAVTDSITEASDPSAIKLANRLRQLLNVGPLLTEKTQFDTLSDSTIGNRMQQQVVSNLSAVELDSMFTRAPALQREVVQKLAQDSTVEQLVARSNESIRTTLSRAAAEEFVPSTSARQRSSINRQSDLLWGATDFVVDRVQQQLQVYALQGFTSRLCSGLGATVLHESCAMLHSETFGFNQPGVSLLRSAVRQDLQALPSSILEWTYSHAAANGTLTDPRKSDQLLTALQITHLALGTARGDDPWLALAEVADRLRGMRDTMGVRLDLSGLRSDSALAEERVAAAQMSLVSLAANDSRVKEAQVRLDTMRMVLDRVRSRLNSAKERVSAVGLGSRTPVAQLLLAISELASTRFDALRLRNVAPADLRAEELLRYQLLAMLANQQERQAIDGRQAFAPGKLVPLALAVNDEIDRLKHLRARIDSVAATRRDSTRSLAALQLELAQQGFSTVETILSQAGQFDEFRTAAGYSHLGAAQRMVVAVRDVVMPVLNGEYGTGLLALRRQVGLFVDSVSAPTWTRGIVFASDLVNAQNSEQVTAALGRFADNGGGVMAKRNARGLRVSLNAYGGVFGGRETADDQGARFGGVYLPVGFSAVLPATVKLVGRRRLGRFGLFVQAVDLGALASWRLSSSSSDNEKIDERPQVGVAQVISPGVFVTFDLHALPLTFGYGGARSPQLREKSQLETTSAGEQTTTHTLVDAVRRGFFIAFDIPLFP